jgi:hypothetical protein
VCEVGRCDVVIDASDVDEQKKRWRVAHGQSASHRKSRLCFLHSGRAAHAIACGPLARVTTQAQGATGGGPTSHRPRNLDGIICPSTGYSCLVLGSSTLATPTTCPRGTSRVSTREFLTQRERSMHGGERTRRRATGSRSWSLLMSVCSSSSDASYA